MDDALGTEALRIFMGVSDIVTVRQKDVSYAAPLGEAAYQMLHVAGRIDQPVAIGMFQEVAVPAKGLRRIEAAVRYTVSQRHRKPGHRLRHALLSGSADRAGGTGHQRLESGEFLSRVARLQFHEREFACLAE